MTITALFLVVIALGIGAIAGWMVGSARKSAEAQRALAECELARTERERAMVERDSAKQERERSERMRAEMQCRLEEAQQARAVAESHFENLEKIEDTFTALAQKAFKDVSESLVSANKTQVGGTLDSMLLPVREMLDAYRGEVQKSEQERAKGYGGLQEQIRNLLTTQELAQREAARLANALQSPTVQGSWGEMSLKRCIELAGMSEYCRDFDSQHTFFSDDGRRLRPDVVINLPNQRVIAIDAKASLTEYIAACNESDETRKAALLHQHAKNLRRHIDALAKRDYQSNIGETLDFAVMFIPGEQFLAAALATDLTLLEYAADRKIFLASPTVLLPLLRAVAASWKAEKTEENAKRMHDAAVDLFNRFVKVMDHLRDVGARLGKTVEKYNETIRSIDSRLWPKGEELQQLAGVGKGMDSLEQIEAVPLESSKLRLTMQSEEPGVVVPMKAES
jgi:DNA recombination protein RmuC